MSSIQKMKQPYYSGTMLHIHIMQVNYPLPLWMFFNSSYLPIDDIVDKLRRAFEPLTIPVLYSRVPLRLDPPSPVVGASQDSPLPNNNATPAVDPSTKGYIILYVGGESLGLTNLLITHASYQASTHIYLHPSVAHELKHKLDR